MILPLCVSLSLSSVSDQFSETLIFSLFAGHSLPHPVPLLSSCLTHYTSLLLFYASLKYRNPRLSLSPLLPLSRPAPSTLAAVLLPPAPTAALCHLSSPLPICTIYHLEAINRGTTIVERPLEDSTELAPSHEMEDSTKPPLASGTDLRGGCSYLGRC